MHLLLLVLILLLLLLQAGRCVLPWWLRLRVAAQISAAIAYLHNLPSSVGGPLIHRDIKPANMFLDGRLNAKVCLCVGGVGGNSQCSTTGTQPVGEGGLQSYGLAVVYV